MRRWSGPQVGLALWLVLIVALAGVTAAAVRSDAPATLEVDVGQPGHAIPARFFGLMTEEINHAYDGGLYAELIQNRSFQDPVRGTAPGAPRGPAQGSHPATGSRGGTADAARQNARGPAPGPPGLPPPPRSAVPLHWSVVGSGQVATDRADPVNPALPVSLRLDLAGGEGGVANDGFWGIPVRPDTTYTARFYARAGGGFAGPVTASLRTDEGNAVVASASTRPISSRWQKYTLTLTTGHEAPTTARARFVLSARGSGRVWFSLVSLFPPTYRNAPNGLRPDLMKLLAELRPTFIRLPGGNYLEGSRFSDRFNWKQMIGPIDARPGHMGCWGYRSSDGFGLPEYLLWCKQLGAEPVLALFAGYVLNGDHFKAGSPEMAVYTREALEEIEYVSGPASSPWGRKRVADGFPQPLPLHYVEIGNEDWFDRSGSYDGRFTEMARAIRRRYPHLKIIATAPVQSFQPDLYDDHYYRSPSRLLQMATTYDRPAGAAASMTFTGGGWNGRQPDGMRTFVGEWAAQEGRPTPTLNAALADAAFLLGLEKDSDAVVMESYAPLLVNVSPADPEKGYPRAWQWNTNLIGYDALHSFGSPSYYAQAMLAQNKGDVVLPARLDVPPAAESAAAPQGGLGVGAWHTQVEYADLSVTAPDGQRLFAADAAGGAAGWACTGGAWRVQENAIQSPADAETWATTGDRRWTDYTVHLRARKLGGREGFIVLWHAADGDHYHWWNIGGWGNTVARCEHAESGSREPYGPETPFRVQTGRWYDLKLEVTGRRFRGFIDGKLVTDATDEPQAAPRSLFATATLAKNPETVIVKIVNASDAPVDMAIHLRGVTRVEPNGLALVLTGEPDAQNSVEEPRKVAPMQETVANAAPSFHRTFPPHSLTILRLKAAR